MKTYRTTYEAALAALGKLPYYRGYDHLVRAQLRYWNTIAPGYDFWHKEEYCGYVVLVVVSGSRKEYCAEVFMFNRAVIRCGWL